MSRVVQVFRQRGVKGDPGEDAISPAEITEIVNDAVEEAIGEIDGGEPDSLFDGEIDGGAP